MLGKRVTRVVPKWVPADVRNYVFHTEMGQPIRVLARAQACHASTILRQVRKVEQRRDDPLVDRAIKALAEEGGAAVVASPLDLMQALRRLAVPGAMLAVALGMDQGVILRDTATGESDHGSKLPLTTAQPLALQGWIATAQAEGATPARVLRYRITPAGRVALRELTAKTENRARAMAEGAASFEAAPEGVGTWGKSWGTSWDANWDDAAPVRAPSHDTPVVCLARRKDRDGSPFLNRAMISASERLREDYEIAELGRRRADQSPPDWDAVLRAIDDHRPLPDAGSEAAKNVRAALAFLGPGLSEVALRCCCHLEGLETTEKQMGWAARSGKVVLRIALQRLVLFYDQTGRLGPKIG